MRRDRESGELLPLKEAWELEVRGPNAVVGYVVDLEAAGSREGAARREAR